MGSGGGESIEYTSSPEQRAISKALLPMYEGFGEYGAQRFFGGAPNLGAPSMSGVLTGQPMYDIPNPATAMPTADWWGSLAPQVKAGLYAPYVEAGKGLMEMMGAGGQLGSATGGFSGAAGAALGELAGKAAQNVGLNAWQMTSPMAMTAWNADLNRNINAYNVGQQERLGDWQTAYNAWQMPMQAMGGMAMGMPQAYTPAQGGGLGGMLSGGLMGGLAGGMLPASLGLGPWGLIGGAALGGLAGLF